MILLAPPIHYGFNEHNMDYPGTINVDPEHFTHYATDVGFSFAHQGFRNIIFANGHGSNAILLELAARRHHPRRCSVCLSFLVEHGRAAEAMAMRESPFPGGMSHACEAETSVYLHVNPSLVDMSKAKADIWSSGSKYVWHDLIQGSPVRFVHFHSKRSVHGTTGDPTLATPAKGEELVTLAARRIAEFANELRTLDWADAARPPRCPGRHPGIQILEAVGPLIDRPVPPSVLPDRELLAEGVARSLAQFIATSRLEPGQKLSSDKSALAQMFRVSTRTICEALLILAEQGVVRTSRVVAPRSPTGVRGS